MEVLHNWEIYNLYPSAGVIRLMKCRRMRRHGWEDRVKIMLKEWFWGRG
jgi:hypothetical protein